MPVTEVRRAAGRAEESLPPLTPEETVRYSRHLVLPDVGVAGQRKLKSSRVLLVGAGGLGSPLALYLAAAGVGTLGMVDFDVVDVTNLHRQLLHGTADVGRPKLDSAADRIADVNPHTRVERYNTRLTSQNALEIMRGYDVVVDGTDNFPTRYLTNDACVLLGIPNVYGSIYRFEGQASVFATANGPCYRCLFRVPPSPGSVPSCAEGGVLGVLPGLIGTIQATETIKLLLGIGAPLVGRLLLVNALDMQFRTVRIDRDPSCPACGTHELRRLIDYDEFCGVSSATRREAVATDVPEITPRQLAARRAAGDDFDLIDVREPHEWEIASLDDSHRIPLGVLADAIPTLDRGRDVVVYCRSGVRSAHAVRQLRAAGFSRVWNLVGGILRWSDEVDPLVAKY